MYVGRQVGGQVGGQVCKECMYVMLCYLMLCYVMIYYILFCYVMLCYIMLFYVMYIYILLYKCFMGYEHSSKAQLVEDNIVTQLIEPSTIRILWDLSWEYGIYTQDMMLG